MGEAFGEMYEKYNTLSEAKENAGQVSRINKCRLSISQFFTFFQHPEEYLYCMKGAAGNVKEKKLAARIIVQFFKHFPALQVQALNTLIDLCEDDEDNNSVGTILNYNISNIYFK